MPVFAEVQALLLTHSLISPRRRSTSVAGRVDFATRCPTSRRDRKAPLLHNQRDYMLNLGRHRIHIRTQDSPFLFHQDSL